MAALPFYANRIVTGRQLKKKDNGIATLSVFGTSVVCFSEGIGGIQYGNKPVPIDSTRIQMIEKTAAEYYNALAAKFGPIMEDRLNTVICTPAVRAALGALGHNLASMQDGVQRETESKRVLDDFGGVDWSKGPNWEGICGKTRSNGAFSTAGGVKDSGGTSYKALADTTSEFYSRVRKPVLMGA